MRMYLPDYRKLGCLLFLVTFWLFAKSYPGSLFLILLLLCLVVLLACFSGLRVSEDEIVSILEDNRGVWMTGKEIQLELCRRRDISLEKWASFNNFYILMMQLEEDGTIETTMMLLPPEKRIGRSRPSVRHYRIF